MKGNKKNERVRERERAGTGAIELYIHIRAPIGSGSLQQKLMTVGPCKGSEYNSDLASRGKAARIFGIC